MVFASYPVTDPEEIRWLDVFVFSRKLLAENAAKSTTNVEILENETILSVVHSSDITDRIKMFFLYEDFIINIQHNCFIFE